MQGPRTPFIYLAVVFGLFVVPQISHYARSVENRTATSTHLIFVRVIFVLLGGSKVMTV